MKITYSVNDQLTIESQAEDIKGAIAMISQLAELLTGEKCGQCDSTRTRPSFRQAGGYDYYGLVCDCGAQLNYGQYKEGGGLFIKRKDHNGNQIGIRGWYHYQRNESRNDSNVNQDIPGDVF